MTDNVIIIPAYNAEAMLGPVLDDVRHYSEDVLVVDDGSTDDTAKVAADRPWVKLHRQRPNQGKGAALAAGFQIARDWGYEMAVTMDADGQHRPEDLPKFFEAYKETGAEIIIGSRFEKGSRTQGHIPLVRLLSNKFSSGLLSWRIGTRISDGQSGYRLYKLDILDICQQKEAGFVWETQILVQAAKRGYKIVNIPIACCYPDGTKSSHYRSIQDSVEIMKAIFKG